MTDKEALRLWAQTWKTHGPELERIRLRELREEDNLLTLQSLASSFNFATRHAPPTESSGLVEMQKIFARLRR